MTTSRFSIALRIAAITAIAILCGMLAARASIRSGSQPSLVLGVTIHGSGTSSDLATGSGNGNANGSTKKRFSISGRGTDLYPGATGTLPLTLSNPNNFDIDVTTLAVAVGDAVAGCAAQNLVVDAFSGPPVRVPKNGSASVSLGVSMLASAPDACQGATFPLTYSGQAVKP